MVAAVMLFATATAYLHGGSLLSCHTASPIFVPIQACVSAAGSAPIVDCDVTRVANAVTFP